MLSDTHACRHQGKRGSYQLCAPCEALCGHGPLWHLWQLQRLPSSAGSARDTWVLLASAAAAAGRPQHACCSPDTPAATRATRPASVDNCLLRAAVPKLSQQHQNMATCHHSHSMPRKTGLSQRTGIISKPFCASPHCSAATVIWTACTLKADAAGVAAWIEKEPQEAWEGWPCLVFQMQGVRGAWLCCQGSAAVVQSPLKITPQQPAGGPLRVDERLQPAAAAVLQLPEALRCTPPHSAACRLRGNPHCISVTACCYHCS